MKTQYDLFISYSHEEGQFVKDWLLPRLEALGLTVCVDYRDFDVGVPILENMEQAVERSQCTIVVLTPNWVESQWANFESLLVSSADPSGRRRRLFPLMLESCKLPTRIAMLNFADFRKSSNHEEEFEKLTSQLRAQSAEGRSGMNDESTVTTFMFDEAHGQRRWRHLPPTIDLGYSEACQAIVGHGSVISNKDGPLTETTLRKCEVLILPMPFGTLVDATEYEALAHWVNQGGCLIMCGFYFMESHLYTNFSTLAKRLQIDFGRNLIMPRGRTTRDDALKQAFAVNRDLCAIVEPSSDAPEHPILSGVKRIALQSSCTIHSRGQKEANSELELQTGINVSVMSPARGEYNDQFEDKFDVIYEYNVEETRSAIFLVAKPFGKGRVIATGTWRVFINDYMADPAVNNSRLFLNSALWLLDVPKQSSIG